MPDLDFSKLDTMSEEEERRFFAAFTQLIERDREEEATRRLRAGRAISYAEDRYADALVKARTVAASS